MQKSVATIDGSVSALEAAKIMAEKGSTYLVVLENTQLAGIVTERDFVARVVARERDPSGTKISEIVSKPLVTINPDATLSEAVKIMAKHGIRKLPVVQNGILCGILTSRDIMRHFNEYEDKVIRDIIRSMAILPRIF